MRSFAVSKERKFGAELDPITSAMRTPQALVPICIIRYNTMLLHEFVQSKKPEIEAQPYRRDQGDSRRRA
jgi:hypothetical protein